MMKEYLLYIWYAWGFGNHWYLREVAGSIEDLKAMMKNRVTSTWKITDRDGNIVAYHIAPGSCWRYGMAKPNIETYSDGRIVEYHG